MCVLQPQCVTASAECLADEHIIVAVRSVDDMEVYGESCNSSWITCYNNLFFEYGFPKCQCIFSLIYSHVLQVSVCCH
jgi:hypothetical protein